MSTNLLLKNFFGINNFRPLAISAFIGPLSLYAVPLTVCKLVEGVTLQAGI